MRPTISLEQISVPKPCSADWNAMNGDERTRFCLACGKHVHDLSVRTRGEAERLLAATPGGLCVQMCVGPDGRIVTRERATCRVPARAISAVLAFALTLVGCRRTDDPTTTPVQRTGGAVTPRRVMGDVDMPLPSTRPAVGPTTAPAAVVLGKIAAPPPTR